MPKDFLAFLERLGAEGLEFVIVGGLAARLYGSSRLTHHVDIVPDLDKRAWRRTVACIVSSGGRPRIPESVERISDPELVSRWVAEKRMRALSFRSEDGSVEIDLLVAESPRFRELRDRATRVELRGVTYFVASLDDLIAMKRAAGRPQDRLDLEELERIRRASRRARPRPRGR